MTRSRSTIPVQKPGAPKGTLDLELDQDGNIWVGLMYQTGMAKFDRTTGSLRIYPIPAEWQTDAAQQSHFSVAGGKANNPPEDFIANLDPDCQWKSIKLSASADGSFTVTNGRNGFSKTYKPKR